MQHNAPEDKTPESKTIIQCSRVFPYPVQDIFAAFLDASILKQWFGPKDSVTGDIHIDARQDGDYAIELHVDTKSLWIKGRYTAIVPNQQLDFTFYYDPDMPDIGKSDVRVVFNQQNDKTEVVLTQVIYKNINPEGRTKGWESSFDRLETLLPHSFMYNFFNP